MQFLIWHYTSGLKIYLRRTSFLLTWLVHYFSLPLLLISLFSPWRRLTDTDDHPGFNLSRELEVMSFNLISRFIGAIVRISVFIFGCFSLALVFWLIVVGLLLWLIFPFLSLSIYFQEQSRSDKFTARLWQSLRRDPGKLWDNPAGKFVLYHTGLSLSDLQASAKFPPPPRSPPMSFQELLAHYIDAKVWSAEFFRSHSCSADDLVLAASWWDNLQPQADPQMHFGQPGIGSQLLFGYTPHLDKYVVDLSTPKSYSHHLIGRLPLMSRLERAMISGNSVILTGQPGVGKKTVVMEFARRAKQGLLDRHLAYRRILDFDYNFLLGSSLDINQKKANLSQILAEASDAGNIILVIKDLHRLTHADVEGVDFTDVFEKYLEKADFKIIAISSQIDFERFIAPNQRLRKFLEPVEVIPPSPDEALQILMQATDAWRAKLGISATVPALRQIIDGSDRYVTDIPFPEKALEILDEVVVFVKADKRTLVTKEDVNTVLSEKTGISLASLTSSQKTLLGNIEEIIHKQLIDQEAAVSAIGKSLRARSVGAKDDSRPVGSFLFLGPTGVGKTQTAKVLSQIYYGSEANILRFDMAEYQGEEGLSRLIGSARRNQPGVLSTAIKNHPASLLLLDEMEKTPPEIYNLFLSLLDEGSFTDAFGKKIICRHLFVIATSNAGAEFIRQQVGKGVSDLQEIVVDHIQKQRIFSPEFLNRFDGVVVFSPLGENELVQIARLMLSDLSKKLLQQNITLSVTDDLCRKLAQDGYDPAFGARTMRRLVDLTLGDLIAQSILSGKVNSGDTITILPGAKKSEFKINKV